MSFKKMVTYWLAIAALAGATACGGGGGGLDLEVHSPDEVDGGVLEGTRASARQNVAISDCGEELLNRFTGTPYVPLVRWQGTGANDHRDRVTTDPQWYGCPGDIRTDGFGLGITYEYVGVLGLVFSPDMPPPSGTVRLHRVFSGALSVNFGMPEKEDMVLYLGPDLGLPLGWGYEYSSDDRSIEGYIYPPNWRPSISDPVLPLYVSAKMRVSNPFEYDFFNELGLVTNLGSSSEKEANPPPAPSGVWMPFDDGITPFPSALLGWVFDPSAVTPLPLGRCQVDDDCLSGERCITNELEPIELGRCVPRCDTRADCNSEYPFCNVAYNVCSRSLVWNSEFDNSDPNQDFPDLDIPDGALVRGSIASYMDGENNILWAGEDEPRWEDRSDGYGPALLVEGEAENLVTQVNELWDPSWDPGALCYYQSSSTPGAHESSLFQVTGANYPCNGVQDTMGGSTLMSAFLPEASFDSSVSLTYPTSVAMSLWSRAGAESMGAVFIDAIDPNGAPSAIDHVSMPTADWTRVELPPLEIDAALDGILVGMHDGSAEGSGRAVAHVQLEAGAYPTSVIAPAEAGTTASRDMDQAIFLGSPEPADPVTFAWAGMIYFWPYFSCADLVAAQSPAIRAMFVVEEAETTTTVPFTALQVYFRVDSDGTGCEVAVHGGLFTDPSELIFPYDWDRHQMLAVVVDDTGAAGTYVEIHGDGATQSGTLSDGLPAGGLYIGVDTTPTGIFDDGNLAPYNGRISPPLPLPDSATRAATEVPRILDLEVSYERTSPTDVEATLTFNTSNFDEIMLVPPVGVATSCETGSKHQCVVGGLTVGTAATFTLRDPDGIDVFSGDLLPSLDCGNGIVEGVEECDDGNVDNGDLCSSECYVILD